MEVGDADVGFPARALEEHFGDAVVQEGSQNGALELPTGVHGFPSLTGFDFDAVAIDKRIDEYSGGNKRKLSTAVALIGSPSVVYLDEPTTGMDPGAKRRLWSVISRYRASGKSIVLTSHSMEECEALCTRLAIMVNGELKCLGSSQHLKNKFSKGYLLTIQMSSRNFDDSQKEVVRVKSFVLANLPRSELKEEHQGRLAYYIPITDTKWSSMFDIMETGTRVLAIESYSLSQKSLAEVFWSFAKVERVRKPPSMEEDSSLTLLILPFLLWD